MNVKIVCSHAHKLYYSVVNTLIVIRLHTTHTIHCTDTTLSLPYSDDERSQSWELGHYVQQCCPCNCKCHPVTISPVIGGYVIRKAGKIVHKDIRTACLGTTQIVPAIETWPTIKSCFFLALMDILLHTMQILFYRFLGWKYSCTTTDSSYTCRKHGSTLLNDITSKIDCVLRERVGLYGKGVETRYTPHYSGSGGLGKENSRAIVTDAQTVWKVYVVERHVYLPQSGVKVQELAVGASLASLQQHITSGKLFTRIGKEHTPIRQHYHIVSEINERGLLLIRSSPWCHVLNISGGGVNFQESEAAVCSVEEVGVSGMEI